jgi:drug/metabolite transporter (DMT)-like permease
MTLIAIGLITLSAFTHASWNFLSKRENPSAAFFLMTTITSSVVLLPLAIIFHVGLPVIPTQVWILLCGTGMTQGLYFIFLAKTYQRGDLSHGYPLARSLPVVLVTIASLLLGRGNQIHTMAYPGFVAITIGCLLLPMPAFRDLDIRHYRSAWVGYAVLAAVCITAYTLIDDQALRILRSTQASPLSSLEWTLLYAELEGISIATFMGGYILVMGKERKLIRHASWPEWWRATRVGLVIVATYGLVLFAMGYVSNVSYISAFRQLSIPIGAALGILVRKEAASSPKLTGIALVMAGLVMVSLA